MSSQQHNIPSNSVHPEALNQILTLETYDESNFKDETYERLIALYKRVSSEEQARGGLGLQGQETESLDWIHKHFPNSKIVKVYSDEGISAIDTEIYERKELYNMIFKDAKKGLFNTIVAYKQDRLARTVEQTEIICKTMDSYSIQIWTTNENKKLNQASPQDKMVRQILASVAENEVESTRSRIKATKKGQRVHGQFAGGDLPYGFTWDKESKKIVEQESEIRVWLQIIYKYLAENKGATTIAKELNAEGISFRTGNKKRFGGGQNKWSKDNVLGLLKNPILTGYLPVRVIKRHIKDDGKKGVSRVRPRDIKLQRTDLLREIIPLEMWYEILDKMETKRTTKVPPRQMTTKWLLSGIMRCQSCGSTMFGKDTGKKSKVTGESFAYYYCSNPECESPTKSVRKGYIEQKVIDDIRSELSIVDSNYEHIKRLALDNLVKQSDDLSFRIDKVVSEISTWKTRLTKIRNEYDEGRWEAEYYQDERKRYESIVKDNEQIIITLKAEQSLKAQEMEEIEVTLDALSLLNNALIIEKADETILQKERALLLMLVDYIEFINNRGIKIHFRAESPDPIPEHFKNKLSEQMRVVFEEIIEGQAEISAVSEYASLSQCRHELQHQ